MEERDARNIKYAVVGVDRELINNLPKGNKKLAAQTVCIFYEDKTAEVLDLTQLDEESRKDAIDSLNEFIKENIENIDNYETLYTDSAAFKRILKKAEKINNPKDNSKLKKALIAAGLIVLAGTLTKCGIDYANSLNDKEKEEDNTLSDVPSMDGKDFDFYSENAIDTAQKELFVKNVMAWLSEKNTKEEWMNTTLTEEQLKEYGLTDPEAIFGFTAEDAYSLALRFGNYSKDQYVTLTGGKEMDITAIMNDAHSQSNGALANIISYYICSNECDLNIETLINFNEAEVAKINEIEGKLREFKTLISEDKKDEAKAKMVEIKAWFKEYAHSTDLEQDNAKSYVLRTFLPACSALSQIYQYTDTIELDLYDTKKDVEVTKKVKTDLFDEITMRTLVLGFTEVDGVGAFDAESFLEEHDISKSRYNLLNTDITSSIADKSVSGQINRLEEANTYISSLRNDDITAEAAFSGASLTIDLNKGNVGEQAAIQMDRLNNVQTTYDELTYGTYEPEVLLEMLNNSLKANNTYPKNMTYLTTIRLSELSMEEKEKNPITQGNKGDTVVDNNKHKEDTNINNTKPSKKDEVLDKDGDKTTIEDAKEEAREEAEKETGIKDASTPEDEKEAEEEAKQEAIPRVQLLQGVYNATFNYFNGGSVIEDGFNTANTYGQTYTDAWATSSDAKIVEYYNKGKQDALDYKKAKEQAGKVTGGEIIIDDEFKDAEISEGAKSSVASEDKTEIEIKEEAENTTEEEKTEVKEETSTENQEEVKEEVSTEDTTTEEKETEDDNTIIFDEFKDAEIYDEPQDPIKSEDNRTDTSEDIEEGYSSEPPAGFAPVVTSTNTAFTEEDLLAYLNTAEGNAWFESVTTSEVNTNQTGYSK